MLQHEAAHAVLHGDVEAGEYQAHRGCARPKPNPPRTPANLLGLDVDASSISYIAGWSNSDLTVLTKTATNVLHAVNTIAAGLGLDAADEAVGAEDVA